MANFNTDVNLTPDFGNVVRNTPKYNVIKFGDGFEQRLTEGLHQNFRTIDLQFTNINETESDTLISFLEARLSNNNESFDYTPLNDVQGKFIVDGDYSKAIPYANRATVTVKFREVFEN
tara:strand:- start:256 stop:612 length:357 start_codon:yes stop_codon:yes gene_type:complete